MIGNPVPPQHHHTMPYQQRMAGIEQVTDADVLCGRGVTTNRHTGNENFRRLVNLNKELYVTSTKKEKMMISRSIVEHVRSLEPPGRFLEKDTTTGLWFDIGDKKAAEKTSQALRDGAACLRKQLSEDLSHPDFLNAVFDDRASLPPLSKGATSKKLKEGKGKGPAKVHRRNFSNPTISGPFKATAALKATPALKKQRSWEVSNGPIKSSEGTKKLRPRLSSSSQVIIPRSPGRSPGSPRSPLIVSSANHMVPSPTLPHPPSPGSIMRRTPLSPTAYGATHRNGSSTFPHRHSYDGPYDMKPRVFGEHSTIDPHQPPTPNAMIRQHQYKIYGMMTPPHSPGARSPHPLTGHPHPLTGAPPQSSPRGAYHSPHGWSPPPHVWKPISPHVYRHPSDGSRSHPGSPAGTEFLQPPSSPREWYSEHRPNLAVPGLGGDSHVFRPRMSPRSGGPRNPPPIPLPPGPSGPRHAFTPPLPPPPRHESPVGDGSRRSHSWIHPLKRNPSFATQGNEKTGEKGRSSRGSREDSNHVTPSPPSTRKSEPIDETTSSEDIMTEPISSPQQEGRKRMDSNMENQVPDENVPSPLPFKPKFDFEDATALFDIPTDFLLSAETLEDCDALMP